MRSDLVKVALYARTSTADGSQDIDLQLDDLKKKAAERGWTIVATHTDTMSGSTSSRPGLDALLVDVDAGKVELVAVWKLDRLGRSMRHLLETLDHFTTAGVGFVSIRNDGIDTTTPAGRLMLHLLAAFAEFEREMIRERVQAGMDRIKRTGRTKSGKPPGRPRVDIDVEKVLALRKEGKTWRFIAMSVGAKVKTIRAAVQRFVAKPSPKTGRPSHLKVVPPK